MLEKRKPLPRNPGRKQRNGNNFSFFFVVRIVAKKSLRESREEIILNRFASALDTDTLPRTIAKMRHRFRDPKNKKRDDCARHSKIASDPDVRWFRKPGTSDVKGIDVPAKPVKEHFRKNPKTGKKDIRVHRHYRLMKKFPDFCGRKR